MSIRRASPCPMFVLLAVGSIATAQDAATPSDTPAAIPAEKSDAPDVSFRLGGFGTYHLKADLDKNGDVSLSRAGGEVGVNIPFGKSVFLDVAFREEMSWYNFSNAIDLGGTDSPWDGPMYDHRLISSLFVRHDENWSYTLAGNVAWSHEDSSASDSMSGGGVGIVTYSFNENFALSAGVAASARLERSARVSPILSIDWKINDQWRVSGRGVGRLANRGPGLALLYSPSETWTFGVGASYETREWRLDDEGVAPDGIAEDARVPIEFSAVWKASKRFSLTGTIGVDAWAEYTLYDKNGERIGDVQADPTPFVGLEAKLVF